MTNLWVTLPVCFFYRIRQPTDPLGEQQSVEFKRTVGAISKGFLRKMSVKGRKRESLMSLYAVFVVMIPK